MQLTHASTKIDGNDHVVTDTIIFAFTSIGIEVNSPGTIIHNVHVWNGLHKIAGLGPGIHVGPGGSTTRISDCYLDNTWLNLVDPSRLAVFGGVHSYLTIITQCSLYDRCLTFSLPTLSSVSLYMNENA